MHILHLANSYGATEVYYNLFSELDKFKIQQTIYVALNHNAHKRVGNQLINFIEKNSTIIYSTRLKWYHKLLYNHKINTIVNDICKKIDMSSISIIHASTLCMDGAVAYELSRKFDIPYIAAIRNTDINAYIKVFVWIKPYFYSIAQNASQLIFISPQYKDLFLNQITNTKAKKVIDSKSKLIPNGINKHYLANRSIITETLSNPIKVVYVGAFQKGKNIHLVIDAINKLRLQGYEIEYNAIGRGLSNRHTVRKYLKTLERLEFEHDWITLYDSMEIDDIINIYAQNDIFIMPSRHETFGLVYVEALSQGLPIIYTRGQGFDGFYKEGEVGYSVDSNNPQDIANGIERIIKNYSKITTQISKIPLSEQFDWNKISKTYITLYSEILSK